MVKHFSDNSMTMNSSPIIYLVNYFSYLYGDEKNIFENFKINSTQSDTLIHCYQDMLKNVTPYTIDNKVISSGFKFYECNLDYRLSPKEFKLLIFQKISAKTTFLFSEEKFINLKNNSPNELNYNLYYENKEIEINLEDKYFNNSFLITKNDEEYDSINKSLLKNDNLKYTINFEKENDKLFINSIQPIKDKRILNESLYDTYEKELNFMLNANGMYINEFLVREKKIIASVAKKNDSLIMSDKKLFSEIIITINEPETEIEIHTENAEDSIFLNKLFHLY